MCISSSLMDHAQALNESTSTSQDAENATGSSITGEIGYRYNGLDLLLCPWSYTCGEPGSPVPPDQIIPTSCCTGCIVNTFAL